MRNFIKLAFVAVFVTMAGYGVYTSQKTSAISDLALANVEALARGESDSYCRTNADYTAICNIYDSGNICPCGF